MSDLTDEQLDALEQRDDSLWIQEAVDRGGVLPIYGEVVIRKPITITSGQSITIDGDGLWRRAGNAECLVYVHPTIYGFQCELASDGMTWAEFDEVLEGFFACLDALGLEAGGGGGQASFDVYITRKGGGSVSKQQRNAVGVWLGNHTRITDYTVHPLTDANAEDVSDDR